MVSVSLSRPLAAAVLCASMAAIAAAGAQAAPSTLPATSAAPVPVATIAALDLPRYMGTWYELARFPNRFQGQCIGPASAEYSLQPGGTVRVVNRCPLAGGQVDTAVGEARRIGPEGSPKLEVRFAPAWLSWLPAVWGDYWVIDLDPDYQLAVVGESTREYLWVLSRTPEIEPARWEALQARLRAQGYDPARLQRAGAAR